MTAGSLHTIPPTIRIHDPSDPRIADYANLKDAELARRDGLFIAEGPLVVRELFRSSFPTRSVLVEQGKLNSLRDALAGLDRAIPVYEADQAVVDAITGFHLHRGVLACGQRQPSPDPIELASRSRVLVILEDLSNHDNIGGLFRTAAALGGPGTAILLSRRCCDPLYRKALRVSIGHILHIPYAWADLDTGLWSRLSAIGYQLLALTPGPGSISINSLPAAESPQPRRPALILGAEGPGLAPQTLAGISAAGGHSVRIPMMQGVDSLNVVVAAGVALSRLGLAEAAPQA